MVLSGPKVNLPKYSSEEMWDCDIVDVRGIDFVRGDCPNMGFGMGFCGWRMGMCLCWFFFFGVMVVGCWLEEGFGGCFVDLRLLARGVRSDLYSPCLRSLKLMFGSILQMLLPLVMCTRCIDGMLSWGSLCSICLNNANVRRSVLRSVLGNSGCSCGVFCSRCC